MKTFKDLVFGKHKVCKGIQASLELKPIYYDVSSFEVAIINENLPDDEQEWDVQGWVSREDINKLIQTHS